MCLFYTFTGEKLLKIKEKNISIKFYKIFKYLNYIFYKIVLKCFFP